MSWAGICHSFFRRVMKTASSVLGKTLSADLKQQCPDLRKLVRKQFSIQTTKTRLSRSRKRSRYSTLLFWTVGNAAYLFVVGECVGLASYWPVVSHLFGLREITSGDIFWYFEQLNKSNPKTRLKTLFKLKLDIISSTRVLGLDSHICPTICIVSVLLEYPTCTNTDS
jgi:hypothetical protein